MRILMSADTVGGVWTYALELARELTAAGDEVLLAAFGGRLDAAQQRAAAAIPGLEVDDRDYRLEWMEEPWGDLELAGQWLRRLETRFRPDIVHLNHYCHGDLPWRTPVLMVAHSCVYSWHDRVKRAAPGADWQRYRREVRAGLAAADWVVAPTQTMLADAVRFYGPFRRQRVIYNGRRSTDFLPAAKQPLILSAGRLWDEAKNVAALAEVAPALSWPVALAGETAHPDGGRYQADSVRCLGRLDAAAMAKAYGEAAIYVMPARYEPFGLSVLEAALAGCALVLGDIPSLRELWQDCAEFVAPDDTPALQRVLENLIENPRGRAELAQRARERALRYSAEAMGGAYRALYKEMRQTPLRRGSPIQGVLACKS